eukprot:scaffold76372_cov31-Tisochrysis_lutea.AAC.1
MPRREGFLHTTIGISIGTGTVAIYLATIAIAIASLALDRNLKDAARLRRWHGCCAHGTAGRARAIDHRHRNKQFWTITLTRKQQTFPCVPGLPTCFHKTSSQVLYSFRLAFQRRMPTCHQSHESCSAHALPVPGSKQHSSSRCRREGQRRLVDDGH